MIACVCVYEVLFVKLSVDVFHRIFSLFISNATTHEAQQAKSFPTLDLLCSLFPPHPFSPFPAKVDTIFKFHVLTGLVLTVLYIIFIAGMCRGLGAAEFCVEKVNMRMTVV